MKYEALDEDSEIFTSPNQSSGFQIDILEEMEELIPPAQMFD